MISTLQASLLGKICRSLKFYSTSSRVERVVSALRPAGSLHLGKYFGAIKPFVELQNKNHECFMCISDVEALSLLYSREANHANVRLLAATLIACGIDPKRSAVYQQSHVFQVAQLDWIFHCLLDKNRCSQLTCQKEKLELVKHVRLGEYCTPVLYSANLLAFKATSVPSGNCAQHRLELSCQIAFKFNDMHGEEIFPVPMSKVADNPSSNILSLRNPELRMRTFDSDLRSTIDILDPPEVILEKCKKSITDFTSEVYFDPVNRPGVSNLMSIHKFVTGKDYSTIRSDLQGQQTSQFKLVVANAISEYFSEIRRKANYILKEPSYIKDFLESGATKAKAECQPTINKVYHHIGFISGINNSSPVVDVAKEIKSHSFSHQQSTRDIIRPTDFKMKRILSGIQPTGVLHLGNYFGAVKQWINLQEEGHDVMICVVDQHAITVPRKRQVLYDSMIFMAASIIGCGVDPSKSIVFQQSSVPEHAQLNSILRNVAFVALLSRQSHYKDKISSTDHSPTLGLFAYPVLQASDILLYRTSHVPVGDDQKQHIQLAVELCNQFNKKYGKIFRKPEAIILDNSLSRLKSLCLPNKKMSKSESNPDSRIEILDPPEDIIRKCMNALVEEGTGIEYDTEKRPGLANLMILHSITSGKSIEDVQFEHCDDNIKIYRRRVAESIIGYLTPIRVRTVRLLGDEAELMLCLEEGSRKARIRAQETIQFVHDKVGFKI